MHRNVALGLFLALLLALTAAGCAPGAENPTAAWTPPPTPVAQVSPQPGPTGTSSAAPPSPTALPTARSASATPTLLPATGSSPEPPAPTAIPPFPSQPDPSAVRLELRKLLGGLDTPVGIANAGDGSGRLFVVEKPGRIRAVAGGALVEPAFLDITERVRSSGSEQGLLGLAFHPNYLKNGFFFVNYTNQEGDTVVSRFAVSADPGRADASGEVVLLTVDQPAGNHNGGHLAFGPDGYLYIGLGDGGGANDQYGNGQNGQSPLGKMLRIDVDGGVPYAIPEDNPFVRDPATLDEIWATGLRNPWRYSFDRLTGDLYIADVGQNRYEEINLQPAAGRGGENYGWPVMEAGHCFPEERSCDRTGLVSPAAEYDHSLGCSVTGGYVYRGREFPALTGIYLYADFCSGRIWGMAPAGDEGWRVAELAQVDARIASFGEDEAGELYLVDMDAGDLYQVAALER